MKPSTSLWSRPLVATSQAQQIFSRENAMIRHTQRVFVGAAFALAALLSGSAEAVLTHYWNFEEPNGTAPPEVKDTTGTRHGNFGGVMSDADRSADVPANSGVVSTRSLDFGTPNPPVTNGAGKYVDVYTPSASYLEMGNTADWTVSLWYKGTDAGGAVQDRVLLGSTAGHANLELRTGGYVVYTHYNGGYQDNVISDAPVNDNVWHNITLVHYANQTADLYVDAVAQVTNESTTTTAGFPWRIGALMTGPGYNGFFTSGKLDDARIYDHALSFPEVYQLVPEPSTVALLGLAGLLAWRRKERS